MNTTITEMERTILKASNNYWTLNIANIFSIPEDLWNLVQSDIENRAYHVQILLADELNEYKGRRNNYMNENIKEIQELYKEKGKRQWKDKKEKRIQDKEVLLYKLYEILIEFSLTQLIFIQDKLDNLEKYIKLVYSPAKTRTFTLPPHYKLIQPKREQNDQF